MASTGSLDMTTTDHSSVTVKSITRMNSTTVVTAFVRVAAKLAFDSNHCLARSKPLLSELGDAESSPRNCSMRWTICTTVV